MNIIKKNTSLLAKIFIVATILFIPNSHALSQTSKDHESEKVVFLTTKFGRAFYDYAFAYEDLCRKANSWINLKAQETPGAMFMTKYYAENINAIRGGKKPWIILYDSTNSARFTKYGWGPFAKVSAPGKQIFSSILCRINFLGTFKPNIKKPEDLAGKRVAVASKAAPFNSTLKYIPYFEKGLGVDVKWQYIGIGQGKDALLNGTVDATVCTFMGKYRLGSDGVTMEIYEATPDSSTLELIASGRKLHLIPFDPQVLMSVYQGEGMMTFHPALLKAGAAKGIDYEAKGFCEWLYNTCDKETPDDIIIELLRVRYEQAEKFGDYHAQFKMQPKNPFPAGAPKKLIHPAVYKAAKQVGFEVIE